MKFRHLQLAQKCFLFRGAIKTSLWALMTQNPELRGEANLQSPHTRRWCSASLLPPSHKLLPRFLPVGCGSARTTMLLRAAQTRPSRAGVHAATSRLPRRSGTNPARDSLPLIKTTGSTLRSDVTPYSRVQKANPGHRLPPPPPPPPSPGSAINNTPLSAEDHKLLQISGRCLKKA